MNLFKGIQGKNIDGVFGWANEPKTWSFENGKLVVLAPPKSDFFIDAEGPSYRDSAPFLFTIAEGDFELTTRVNVDMKFTYDSACLMFMDDPWHWAKLCYENWMDEPAIVSVVTKEMSDDCPSYKIGNVRPHLKILRAKNSFGFHYSLDGENWTIVRYFNMTAPQKLRVGIAAQCPVGEGCNIEFDFLELQEKSIESAKVVPKK